MSRLTYKFRRFIADAGLAVSSIIAPTSMHAEPFQPEKRREAPSNRDGVKSSCFMEDRKWEGVKWFDSRLAVYTVLDDMVNFQEPDKDGHYWESVSYNIEVDGKVSYCVLSGIKNDGNSISIKAKIEKQGSINELFYRLCNDLNDGNWNKPKSRIVGVDGFRG